MKRFVAFLFTIGLISGKLFAQCAPGEVSISVDVTTDQWGYETYWELVPKDSVCGGNATIFAGGNSTVGCAGGSGQSAAAGNAGAYGNSTNISEGPFCLVDGASYDIKHIDDWGDGGTSFSVATNGFPVFTGVGGSSTHTFVAMALPDNDANLLSLTSVDYVTLGNNVNISGKIKNNGALAITSLDVKWDDGSIFQTQTISGLNIASGATGMFTHPTLLNIANPIEYNVTVTLLQPGDADSTNNEMSFATVGLANPPARTHVFEEATGTWCGWCPRGAVGLNELEAKSNTIGIAVHNGDPMVVSAYDNGIGSFISGYPSGLINRSDKMTGAFDIDPGSFVTVYDSGNLTDISPFGVSVNATNWDAAARTLDVVVTTSVHADLTGDYRFNVVMVENDVQGTSSGYNQTNYYSSSSQNISLVTTDVNGNTVDWQNQANPLSAADLNTIFGGHQHVARSLEGGWNGIANSLPSTLINGDTHSYTFTVSIDAAWDIEKMKAVGWVSNTSSGEILNAAETGLLWTVTSVNEVVADGFATVIYPNPNNGVFNVVINSSTVEMYQIEINNMLGQVVYSSSISVDGISNSLLDLSSFEKGMYLVTVKGKDVHKTTKIVVK